LLPVLARAAGVSNPGEGKARYRDDEGRGYGIA
jgi:hypothetical protein